LLQWGQDRQLGFQLASADGDAIDATLTPCLGPTEQESESGSTQASIVAAGTGGTDNTQSPRVANSRIQNEESVQEAKSSTEASSSDSEMASCTYEIKLDMTGDGEDDDDDESICSLTDTNSTCAAESVGSSELSVSSDSSIWNLQFDFNLSGELSGLGEKELPRRRCRSAGESCIRAGSIAEGTQGETALWHAIEQVAAGRVASKSKHKHTRVHSWI
jgi:hypothetical protein